MSVVYTVCGHRLWLSPGKYSRHTTFLLLANSELGCVIYETVTKRCALALQRTKEVTVKRTTGTEALFLERR